MSLFTDKKAVSEMLSYVMLIVIALALSGLVFTYLKVFVPKDKPECPSDIAIKIKEVGCQINASQAKLTILLENNGLFNIDAAYVRIGPQGKKVLTSINDPSDGDFGFYINLSPQNKFVWQKNLSGYLPGNFSLEIQPAVMQSNSPVICAFVAREDLQCN